MGVRWGKGASVKEQTWYSIIASQISSTIPFSLSMFSVFIKNFATLPCFFYRVEVFANVIQFAIKASYAGY